MEYEKWRRVETEGGLQWERVRRYRVMSFKKPLAPWRESKEEAELDALDAGVADRGSEGRVFVLVPAWIWIADPCLATEKGLRSRRPRQLGEVANAA